MEIVSDVAIEKAKEIDEMVEKERLAKVMINKYNICPLCGSQLKDSVIPPPKITFLKRIFGSWGVAGYTKSCPTHGLIKQVDPYIARDNEDYL